MSVPIEDPNLGNLAWDKHLLLWAGEVWFRPGHRINFVIEFNPERDAQAVVLSQAHQRLQTVREREPEYRKWTAEELIGWRWNKDEPMTLGDVIVQLLLVCIWCSADGSSRLYWDDDDRLFGGQRFYTRLEVGEMCSEVRLDSVI